MFESWIAGPQQPFSSPLSVRSVNIQTSPLHSSAFGGPCIDFRSMPPTPPQTPIKQISSEEQRRSTHVALPQLQQPRRPRKEDANPLNRTSDQRAQERRNRFFAESRARRDDARWNTRGDQIQRQDFLEQQRVWLQHLTESAPPLDEEESWFEEESSTGNTNGPGFEIWYDAVDQQADVMETSQPQDRTIDEEAELEAFLLAEQEELEAQLALQDQMQTQSDYHNTSSKYGSDDEEEYDRLFAELAESNDMDMT